jgi:hypothetical protein
MDSRQIDLLTQPQLKRVCVSVDGSKEAHERHRGRGTYERALDTVLELHRRGANVTVISVLTGTTSTDWEQLTFALARAGVRQHHLSPVCFAGTAMQRYDGLSLSHFASVRRRVNALKNNLPDRFALRFHDVLLHGIEDSRWLSLQAFSEAVKGWQVVVRPDGDVNGAIRGWGRSWRQNERIGNIKGEVLDTILDRFRTERCEWLSYVFSAKEELQRKFHLNASADLIEEDIREVDEPPAANQAHAAACGFRPVISEQLLRPWAADEVKMLSGLIAEAPERYRIRSDADFALIFDQRSFEISAMHPNHIEQAYLAL